MHFGIAVPEDVVAIAAVYVASWRTTDRDLMPEWVLRGPS